MRIGQQVKLYSNARVRHRPPASSHTFKTIFASAPLPIASMTSVDREGCRVERDAPAGYVRPLIEPYVQISRIRLSVWKFVFIAPVPRTFSVSFHFGHDGIVQLGQAVCGSPHHLRIAPFDSPFGQYISYPHVLCLPFSRRGPSHPRALPRFPATMASSDSSLRFRYCEASQVPD